MQQQIILQGISLDEFMNTIEVKFLESQKKAIENDKQLNINVDWNKYSELMSTDDLLRIFPVKRGTMLGWINTKKFGDFVKDGKLLFVHKTAVQKYYQNNLKSDKR